MISTIFKSVRRIIKGDSTEVYNINIVPEKESAIHMETQTAQGLAAQISHNVSIGDELREQERIQAIGSSISDSSSDVPEDVKGLLFWGTYFTKIKLRPLPV